MAIRGIIFDYGEVLCDAPPDDAWNKLAVAAGVHRDILTQAYWDFRDEYDRGAVTGEQYWQDVARAAGIAPFTADVVDQLIALDCAQWSTLRPDMINWACSLPGQGIRTAVLSNMHYDLLRQLRRDCDWLQTFAHQTYSCEVGLVKPSYEIYQHCLAGLGTPAEETVFLDDRAANVEAARALGIHAHLFTGMADLPEELGALRPRA